MQLEPSMLCNVVKGKKLKNLAGFDNFREMV